MASEIYTMNTLFRMMAAGRSVFKYLLGDNGTLTEGPTVDFDSRIATLGSSPPW